MSGAHNNWKSRVLELEALVSLINQAMATVPLEQLELGHQWFPSSETVALLRRVRGFARSYADQHFNGNGAAI